MSVIAAYGLAGALPNTVNLSTAQTGNGPSDNVADRGDRSDRTSLLTIVTTVGATPTCTYAIEVSTDGDNWWPAPYANLATPETVSVATFVITSATTTHKILKQWYPWRYLRLTYSANTNVTNTADVWTY